MTTKANMKHKALSVFEKLEIIKVYAQPCDASKGCGTT
jgi:hypothetical protein